VAEFAPVRHHTPYARRPAEDVSPSAHRCAVAAAELNACNEVRDLASPGKFTQRTITEGQRHGGFVQGVVLDTGQVVSPGRARAVQGENEALGIDRHRG
jgi:hypothetical protein